MSVGRVLVLVGGVPGQDGNGTGVVVIGEVVPPVGAQTGEVEVEGFLEISHYSNFIKRRESLPQ